VNAKFYDVFVVRSNSEAKRLMLISLLYANANAIFMFENSDN